MNKSFSIQAAVKQGFLILTVCLNLFAFNSCGNDEPDPNFDDSSKNPSVITGRVIDASTNLPMSNTFVELFPDEIYTYTNSYGEFQFNDLSSGEYTEVSMAAGYESSLITVNVKSGKTADCILYMSPTSNPSPNPNPNPNPDPGTIEDYSSAEILCDLPDIEVELISCKRKSGNIVELTYTMTNTDVLHKQGVTLNNVNAFTGHTHIADNLGNQYPNDQVKISLAGKDFGYGNNIEGTLLSDIPAKVVITVKAVDPQAKKMNYYIYTSAAKSGGVNYTSDVVLKNVNIY